MKNKKPTSLIAALSLLVPMGAFAQAGSTGSSGSSSQYPSTGSSTQSSTSQQYPSGSTGSSGSSSQYPSTGSSTQSGTSQQYPSAGSSRHDRGVSGQISSSHGQQFKLISEDKLKDKKLTAENLIGKKIVDRDGQVIGKVKDIGLGSAVQDDSHGASQPYASSGSGTTGAGAMTGRPSGATSSSATTGATTGAAAMMGRSSDQSEQLTLYVELDDSVDIDGDDLAAIPASRVRFDSSKEELKLQLGRSELASQLKQSGSSSNR